MSFCEPGYVWNDARSLCVASVTKPEKNLGPGTLCAGNPINVGTGNKYQRERDYEGAGAYPLRLERHYNSSGVVQSGALGANWRHHYERSLTRIGDIVWVYRHNGKQLRFTRGTDGLWHGEPDVTLRLSETTDVSGAQDGWAIDSADDEHETYDLGLGDSRLTSIRNRAGHTHTLTYRQGRLDTVADGFGRTLTFEYTSNGLNVTDPGNNVFAYRQDSEKRLETVRYPDDTADDSDNPTKLYLYEDPSFLKALTGLVNENGKRFATWSYDSAGRAVSSEHAGAVERTTIAYNPDGSRTVTDASNTQHVTFEPKHGVLLANSTDQPCSASNAQFASTAYDANGFLTRRTDFNNYVTNYIFNDRGLEESRTEAFGTPEARTITTVWNPTWRKPDTIMRDGQVIAFTYDAAGRLLTRTETDTATLKSRTVTRTYNTLGLLETIDGPRVDVSDVTTLVYYPNGDRHTSTNALGHVTTFNLYDAHGRVTKMTDPNGLVTEFAYDVRGRLIERRVDSLVTRFGYDLAGNLTRLTSPDNSVLSYEYDAANRLTDIVDALGNRITDTLDADGNRVKEDVFLPDGVTLVRTQSMEYDKMRRVKKRRSGVGQTQEFEYDDVGNLLVTIDGKLQRTVRMPDPLRRVSSITDAASSITQFAYDARDNLLVVTDPRGLATQYEHDGLDDLIQLISPDTGLTSYVNDEAGNRTASTDARGVNVATAYDALNRVTTVIYPDASLNITNTYDSAPNGVGRLARVTDASGQTQFVYDLRGNVVQQTRAMAGASYVVDYAYDSMDRVSRIAYPSGASVGYLRDTLGQVNQVELTHEGTTQVLASAIGYEPFGAAKDIVLGNALPISRNFDLAGRLTSIDTVGVLERDYVFDANDNITLIDDIHNPAATQTFDYDALNRVTAAEGVYGALTYAYDALGNRTRRGAPEGSDTYRYDAFSNRLQEVAGSNAQNFGYDAAGNIVTRGARTYDYDDSGRLAVALNAGQVQATYGYNANGERSLKATALEQTHFVFASDGLLLMEAVKGVGVTRESVYLNGQLLAVVTPGAGGGDGLLNFADTTASVQVDEVARTVKLTLADGREFAVTVAAANWSETEDDSVRLIQFTGVTPQGSPHLVSAIRAIRY